MASVNQFKCSALIDQDFSQVLVIFVFFLAVFDIHAVVLIHLQAFQIAQVIDRLALRANSDETRSTITPENKMETALSELLTSNDDTNPPLTLHVVPDAERCDNVEDRQGHSGATSRDTSKEGALLTTKQQRNVNLCTHKRFHGIFVHQERDSKTAFNLKNEMEKKITCHDGKTEDSVKLQLHGNIQSAPLFGTLETICKLTKNIILLWTPGCENNVKFEKICQTLFGQLAASRVIDIILILWGFRENENPRECIITNNLIPVRYDGSEHFFATMKDLLLRQPSEDYCKDCEVKPPPRTKNEFPIQHELMTADINTRIATDRHKDSLSEMDPKVTDTTSRKHEYHDLNLPQHVISDGLMLPPRSHVPDVSSITAESDNKIPRQSKDPWTEGSDTANISAEHRCKVGPSSANAIGHNQQGQPTRKVRPEAESENTQRKHVVDIFEKIQELKVNEHTNEWAGVRPASSVGRIEPPEGQHTKETEKLSATDTNLSTISMGREMAQRNELKKSGCAAHIDCHLSNDVVPDTDADGLRRNTMSDRHREDELRGAIENKGFCKDRDVEGDETEGAVSEAGQSEKQACAQESLESGDDNRASLSHIPHAADMRHGDSQHEPKTEDGSLSFSEQRDISEDGAVFYTCTLEGGSCKLKCSDKEEIEMLVPTALRKNLYRDKGYVCTGDDDSKVDLHRALHVQLKSTMGKAGVSISELDHCKGSNASACSETIREESPAPFSNQDELTGIKNDSNAALASESSEDTCHEPAISSDMQKLDENDSDWKDTRNESAEGNTIAGFENEGAREQRESSAERDCGSKEGQVQRQPTEHDAAISSIIWEDDVEKKIDGKMEQNNKYAIQTSNVADSFQSKSDY